jgi:hypothetical protein
MTKFSEQWEFYKQVRILNPSNLPDMSHSENDYPMLRLPVNDPKFAADWQKYCRVENVHPPDPADLMAYWSKHTGALADAAKFLLSVPLTSADVEPMPFCIIRLSQRSSLFLK